MRRSGLQISQRLRAAQQQNSGAVQAALGGTASSTAGASSAASLLSWFATSRASQGLAAAAARAAPGAPHQPARGLRSMTFPSRRGGGGWANMLNVEPSRAVWGLIAANGAVFMLWRSHPQLMSRHFVVSLDSLRDGRYWTAVTAAFSQHDVGHLAANMISLYFFGSGVGQLFGGRKLLLLYLAGGVAGSLAHCAQTFYQERKSGLAQRPAWMRGPSKGALGASAAVNAIVCLDILLFPTRTILLYGFIPLPAALLGLLYFWNDMSGALTPGASTIAHAGHLGGAATGVLYWLAFRRGLIRPQRFW